MDDQTHKILPKDNATPDEIFALIGEQARIAFQAELDFFEWQADNGPAHFDEFMDHYVQWHFCAEPLAESYVRIKSEYPHLMEKIEAIVLPIQREILGTD
jgi:hypothetical protein